jgi:hypothetical protein
VAIEGLQVSDQPINRSCHNLQSCTIELCASNMPSHGTSLITTNMELKLETPSNSIMHTYIPLAEANGIRLMHLEPALDPHAPLRFAFTHAHVTDLATEYEAISYTWGEHRLAFPLYIGDACVLVTKNLDRVLRRLRRPTTTRALWADAVCINQTDNDEKSQQIPLMSKIFRGASRVLAWLDGGADEERGMYMLHTLTRQTRSTAGSTMEDSVKALFKAWEHDSSLPFIHNFLSLAWFTRVWIIQEIVMNTDITLMCGTSEITWIRLATAMQILEKNLTKIVPTKWQRKLDALQVIINLWRYHNTIDKPKKNNWGNEEQEMEQEGFLGIVNMLSSYNCTDDRDRLFALYTMASDIQPTSHLLQSLDEDTHGGLFGSHTKPLSKICMDIDYSLDTRQTYQAFAAACIAANRGLPLLHCVLSRQYAFSSPEWPSWVPDWRVPPSRVYRPFNESIICNQITPDIVQIGTIIDGPLDINMIVVETVTKVPETAAEFTSFLRMMCKDWSFTALFSMLRTFLSHRDISGEDQSAYVDYILERNIRAPPRDTSPQRMDPISLDLHSAMQNQCFFLARSESVLSLQLASGHGIATMAIGDRLLRLLGLFSSSEPIALVLRPKPTGVEIVRGQTITTHRLLGSAYIASDAMFPQQKRSRVARPHYLRTPQTKVYLE